MSNYRKEMIKSYNEAVQNLKEKSFEDVIKEIDWDEDPDNIEIPETDDEETEDKKDEITIKQEPEKVDNTIINDEDEIEKDTGIQEPDFIRPNEYKDKYDYKLPTEREELQAKLQDPNISDEEKQQIEDRLHKISVEKYNRDKATNSDYARVEEAYKIWHDMYGDFGNMKTLLKNEINPSALYNIPWREENGDSKSVFYARMNKEGTGIQAFDLNYEPWKDNSGVEHWKLVTGKARDLSFEEFYDIIHQDINKAWLNEVERKWGNDYKKLYDTFEDREENMKNIYFKWYDDYKEDLVGLTANQLADAFYVVFNLDGDIDDAIKHVKSRMKESTLSEALLDLLESEKQITHAKDSVKLKQLLHALYINPYYCENVFTYNSDLTNNKQQKTLGDIFADLSKKEDQKVVISGLPDLPLEDIKKLNKIYLTEIRPDGSSRKFTAELDKVRNITSRRDEEIHPEMQGDIPELGSKPDIWEQAANPKTWALRKETTPRGEWVILPDEAIDTIIDRMSETEEFKNLNIKKHYWNAKNNNLRQKGIIRQAVKNYDPSQSIMVDRKGNFRIWKSYMNAKPKKSGNNPFRRIMQSF